MTVEIGDYSFEGDSKFFNSMYKRILEVTPMTENFGKEAVELLVIELVRIKQELQRIIKSKIII
jgi:hypothetical protein